MKTVTMNLYRNQKYGDQILNGIKLVVVDESNKTCYYRRMHTYLEGLNLFRAMWLIANRPTCKRSTFKGTDYLVPCGVLKFELP